VYSKSIGILISAVTLSFGTDILDLPKEAESIALGNSGVAFSNQPSSVSLNPASGAFYGARSGLNAWGSLSTGKPYYNPEIFPDWRLNIGNMGVYFKDTNWGVSLSEQFEKFKYPFEQFNNDGTRNPEKTNSYDFVSLTTASIQWKEMIGFGASIKTAKFHVYDDEVGRTLLFDLGIRGQFKKSFSEKFYLSPGAGIAFQNLGKDSISGAEYSTTPVYAKQIVGGLSFECGMPDAFWVMVEEDISKPLAMFPLTVGNTQTC